MIARLRSNPSGRLIQPKPALGQVNYNCLAPLSLELVAADHPPGLYQIAITFYTVTVANAGTMGCSIAYSHPLFGATTLAVGIAAPTLPGFNNVAFRLVESSGATAIVLTFTPAGVTGTPSQQIACEGFIIALPVES